MKKLLFGAVAVMVIASCSKNQTIEEWVPQEISYETISTKAASSFSESSKFYSYAYFLENGKSWEANKADAQEYISSQLIEFNSVDKAWRNASTAYYWPKQGSLTFFAWTDNTSAPAVSGNAPTCTTDGIQIASYDITSNRNKDLLVADFVKDQTSNTTQYGEWQKGVPTVFRHVQSSLAFEAKTAKRYSDATFKITGIKLANVETTETYNQKVNDTDATVWSSETSPVKAAELPVASLTTDATYTVTETVQTLKPDDSKDYTIVLPQKFTSDDQTITVTYTITTNYGTSMTQNCTVTKKLSEVYSNNWEPGKKYTLTLTLSLDEILWAPNVEDWTVGTVSPITE